MFPSTNEVGSLVSSSDHSTREPYLKAPCKKYPVKVAPAPLKSRRGPWLCTNFRAMANIPQLFPFLDSSMPKRCYRWIWMHICWIKSSSSIHDETCQLHSISLRCLGSSWGCCIKTMEFPTSWASMCAQFPALWIRKENINKGARKCEQISYISYIS